MRCRAAAVVLAALAAVAALAGCGDSAVPSGPVPSGPVPSAVAPDLGALVWRSRPDEAAGHRLQVKLTNHGASAVTVTAVRLRDHGFAELPPTVLDVEYAPGRRIDLPVPIGAARCPADAPPSPVAEVAWRTPDGRSGTTDVAAQVQDDVLARARREECAEGAVARAATVSLVVPPPAAGPGSGPGARFSAALRLERPAGGDDPAVLRVTGLDGNILYDLRTAPGTHWPQTLDAGAPSLDVPLRVGAATCDGHRLGEAKKPYVFLAFVELGASREPVTVTVTVDAGTRDVLARLLRTVCR